MRLYQCNSCGKQQVWDRSPEYWNFVHVEANEDSDHADLCDWDCLAAWAMSKAMEKREINQS